MVRRGTEAVNEHEKKRSSHSASTLPPSSSSPSSSTTINTTHRPKKKKKNMTSLFNNLIHSAAQSISGLTTPNPGTPPNATSIDALFPKVDPKVDGDDCLRDCEHCEVKYPKGFKIEEEDKLYGFVKGWSTHVLVATGKTDWVRDVEDEKGSVMEAFGRSQKPSNGRLMLSASNCPTPTHHNDYEEPTSILLLPAFVIIDNVTPENVPTLITKFINEAPTTTTSISSPKPPPSSPSTTIPTPLPPPNPLPSANDLTSRPSPHSALILLCSQKTRDARCGQSAPLLRKELERHLRPLGLFRDLDDERPGGVGIYFISHVGGHKYSANMMVYRRRDAFGLDAVRRADEAEKGGDREGVVMPRKKKVGVVVDEEEREEGAAQCIWLARVRPEDCEGIVRFTVLQGKVVKPERQLRGGFDRERVVFSW